jgi:hypothetical protein
VQRVRRKFEQKQILMAQAEIRETRTRRQTRRPDYVYNDVESGEVGYLLQVRINLVADLILLCKDDIDEYKFEDENENDDDDAFDHDDFLNFRPETRGKRRAAGIPPQRRSSRVARGKRSSPDFSAHEWRGERRSSRLGAPEDIQPDHPPKRARTEESTASSGSVGLPGPEVAPPDGEQKVQNQGAAAMKSNEIPMEQVNGKKKSKFWYYAVEPVAGPAQPSILGSKILTTTNGDRHNNTSNGWSSLGPEVDDGMDVDRCMDEPPPSFATEQAQRPLLSGGD